MNFAYQPSADIALANNICGAGSARWRVGLDDWVQCSANTCMS